MARLEEIAPKYAQGRGYMAYVRDNKEHRCLLGLVLAAYEAQVARVPHRMLVLPRSHLRVKVYDGGYYLHLPPQVTKWSGLCDAQQVILTQINDSQDVDLGPTWWRQVWSQFVYVCGEHGLYVKNTDHIIGGK